MGNETVLAMYDVRGKQEYIYRSRRIREIIGASAIIRDVFEDYLYPAAKKVRNRKRKLEGEAIYRYEKTKRIEEIEGFSEKAFRKRMEGEQYIGEVVYDGGGNFLVLYQDKETCIAVNRIFTRELMKHTGTLKVLCTILKEEPNFKDYREDSKQLYDQHRRNEATESVIYPVNNLPFSQVDPLTSRPFTTKRYVPGEEKGEEKKMSLERAAKCDKYEKEKENGDGGELILDNIVQEKGEESLLAVIYIDGNSMGAKVQSCLKEKSYEACITRLRKFSAEIQRDYVEERIKAINTMLDNKYKDQDGKKRRTIVAAGDEMTIICNARDALRVVKTYFEGLPEEGSSCAGIAVFHSHAPYADAYRLAEECCESGKDFMKEKELSNACLMDFHYCQGGMGISLKQIRKKELPWEKPSRPWILDEISNDKPKEFYYSLEMAEKMAEILRKLGRSNVKTLMNAALNSPAEFELELERINAHREEPVDFTLKTLGKEQKRKLLYDMILVYDLWFREEGKEERV